MSKVVIIGIDGLDPILIKEWKEILPNFLKLYNYNPNITIESTFPPDSICAWISIFTGQNPAEHGIIENIDYLSSKKIENCKDKTVTFKGKTFWDIASNCGKEVCVINPFLAYPAWKVNGVMVSGPVFEGGQISTYPEEIFNNYMFPSLGGIVAFPDEKNLDKFISTTKYLTEQLSDVSLRLFKERNPDIFFVTFLTLDRIKHFLWRFTDTKDPYYPGENSFKDSIKNFYILFDAIVGEFLNSMDKNTSLLVISDHGHRRKSLNCLNLNEYLRNKKYVKVSGKGMKGVFKKLLEKVKIFTIASLSNYNLQDWIYKIAKIIPNRKILKKSTYLIDKNKTFVNLSNICGTNHYGGINIKSNTKEEYEKLRNDVTRDLMDLNTLLGKNIVKWVKRREQVYSGSNEAKLPDLLFELDDDFGVGMDFFTKLITPNYTHRKISGGHKKEAVLMLFSNHDISNIKRPVSVIGIKDFILQLADN